ncbi:MAG: insulinase family protein [Acidobacteria bacterium]|nr:insulinase family protein [Acidobacteriota bacterium]
MNKRVFLRPFLLSFAIFALLVNGLAVAVPAQTGARLPEGIVKGATVEGITEYRMDNGLRILLFPDQTKQTITVNVTYMVGSRHENYGETGMAHLLEHLVFKGTPRHPNIPKELTERGTAPNGTTWYDRTNYFATFAATDDNLEWALDLEADRMVNSFIAKKDLESEFSVVRNEFESGENSPFRVTLQRMMATAFEWHNYGKTTIGARSDIENVPIERLQAFYRKYYQPDNAVLLVAGKFDVDKTLGLIKKTFGAIPKPERQLQPIYTVEPVQDGERMVTVRRTGDIQLVGAGYRIPAGSHPDAAALNILADVVAGGPSSKLYKLLVETKKATSVSGNVFEFHDPGYKFYAATLAKDGNVDEVRDIMVSTLESFAKEPPTKEEVERSKTAILKDIEQTLNDPNRVGLGLSEYIAMGDWRLFFINRDRIRNVTPEDVQRVARQYLKQSNRTVAKFIPTETPDRAEIPMVSQDELAKLVNEYKGGEAIAAGEAFDPTPTNIESRTVRSQIGGIKTAFLTKENRGDTVFANMRLRFGDEKSLMNRSAIANMVGSLLTRGTAKRTRQQIQDEFDRLKATVRVSGGATSANVSIETTRQNLPEVINLVAEILKEPSFPENEFDTLKSQTIAGLESGRSDPTQVALRAMQKHFNRYPKGDIRYSGTLDEDIEETKAITLADVKAFHKDFYGASNGELAVVGDFDPQAVTSLVERHFGNWKSSKPYARVITGHADVAAANETFETPDKANAFFLARLNIQMNNDHPDYAAMQIASSIIGGGFLNSRLATRIRQKDGLSYGVGAGLQVPSVGDSAVFFGQAIYAPENRDKLEAAFMEEMVKVINEGFTAEELASAKQGYLLAQQRQRASDGSIASGLASYLEIGRTYQWNAELEAKVQALTLEQVNAAVKRHITPSKISIFKAGDFAKAKAAGQ